MTMKKTSFAALALLLAVFILASSCSKKNPATSPNATVRVGAFNVQMFGESKAKKANVMTALARIASTYDVLAIEEVGSNASAASDESCASVMDAYLRRINELAGADAYAYCRGDQYAILYRRSAFALQGSSPYSGSQSFSYRPLAAYFKAKAGNLDFAMLVIHTSPPKAKEEIPALRTAMAEVARQYGEPDVVCLGDFNADGGYFTEGSGTALAGFDGFISAIGNGEDTTIASSSNTYDRIELSSSMSPDFSGNAGVFRFGESMDVSLCEGSEKRRGTESAVSDHYPVWAELYLSRDTD
jgi:endonuclease/exonuclease/phosphatase family metal-dependent hydrolase